MKWHYQNGAFTLGESPLLMGILNMTPDSFSDGGLFSDPGKALKRCLQMVADGADLIDVGGESTRPGSQPVSATEECDRVLPVIEALSGERPDIIISIDTTKADVARRAIKAGARIVNDISGGLWDPEMLSVVHQTKTGYVCTHTLDHPDRMQADPRYQNVVEDILQFLLDRRETLREAGISDEAVCFDVGIGFGKTLDHNLDLIRAGGRDAFRSLQRPMLWGLSRKSFIEKVTGRAVSDRFAGGMAAHACLLSSATPQIWRVHDVRKTADFLKMHARLAC